MGKRKRIGVPERRDRDAIGDRGRDLGAELLRFFEPFSAAPLFASLFLSGVEEGFAIEPFWAGDAQACGEKAPSLTRRAVSGSSEFHPLSLLRSHASDSEGLLPCLYNKLDFRWRTGFGSDFLRRFSSANHRDDIDETALEEEAEKKMGWLLKLIFIATGSLVAFQFFPYMGDNLLQQSISLLLVKDPLFKRMGASRLSRFAVDDERRMKVVEMGGAQKLLDMLEVAKDDKTRKYALKALVALSHSDAAAEVLHQSGAVPIVSGTPDSVEYSEIGTYKSNLLKRFEDLKREAEVN